MYTAASGIVCKLSAGPSDSCVAKLKAGGLVSFSDIYSLHIYLIGFVAARAAGARLLTAINTEC